MIFSHPRSRAASAPTLPLETPALSSEDLRARKAEPQPPNLAGPDDDADLGEANLPVKFFRNVRLILDEKGQPTISPGSGVELPLEQLKHYDSVDVVFRDNKIMYHYFHFMELMIVLAAIQLRFGGKISVRSAYVGLQHWNNAAQNNAQRSILKIIQRPKYIVEDFNDTRPISDAALVIDRWGHPQPLRYNKFVEPVMSFASPYLAEVRSQVWRSTGSLMREAHWSRVAYVRRNGIRSLLPDVEARMLDLLSPLHVEVVDFAQMTLTQQIRYAFGSNAMIGVHGNGLTNSFWMRSRSHLLELFPKDFHTYDYQFNAELAQLRYVGLEARETGGYVFTNAVRTGSHYGHNDAKLVELPWDKLEAWRDDLLQTPRPDRYEGMLA